MGLYRTALRLATLEALRPSVLLKTAVPAWPTLAETRVFDSRIDPIEDLTVDQHKAVIVVYTQEDLGYGSQTRGGPPFRRVVDLHFEISQIARVADENRYVAGVPQTDGELEAELDRIEYEIGLALFDAPVGKVWRDLTGSAVTDPRSTPHRDSEEGARLAMRSLVWKVQVADNVADLLPLTVITDPIRRLPQPLRHVVQAFPGSTYVAALGLGLGETMPMLPVAVPLRQVTVAAEIVAAGAARTGAPNVNVSVPLAGLPAAIVSDAGGSVGSAAAVAADAAASNETE